MPEVFWTLKHFTIIISILEINKNEQLVNNKTEKINFQIINQMGPFDQQKTRKS